MNVLIISRCTKHARDESCRIIDQFAERMGDSAWQTQITLDGLDTLRRLLRKTARRNTAVACHWQKKNGQSELMWIVGNLRRFNAQGRAPTHRTSQAVPGQRAEHGWNSVESIALLAAIAGLFHDFGKAGKCFQQTLAGKGKRSYQPYRHEWISVRLFEAFVDGRSDAEWLASLEHLSKNDEETLLTKLKIDVDKKTAGSPLKMLEPLAKTVAWLILSHHRLPQALNFNPSFESCENWINNQLTPDWNALNHRRPDAQWKDADFKNVWTFPTGTPLRSKVWCEKARQIGKRVKNAVSLKDYGGFDNLFTQHLARMTLMLADHVYSSQPAQSGWQDARYNVWANSDRKTLELKQKLDEHCTGVAHHALLLGRSLPWIRRSLPAIARHKIFRERAINPRFHWQNRAWDAACGLRESSVGQGFFGVNMASTGCGKTFANARIMYALANEGEGCRFSVALGLRALTLQTGQALQARLKLNEEDIAVLTGSAAARELFGQTEDDNNSDSASDFFAEHQYVHYDGSMSNGMVQQWLEKDAKLNRLVSAPLLITTIDHLIPATEGTRGGQQIPAMLRLLTSDLVLDEPDDFDTADQPAICRLVHFAGMLGSRVLLSSATLPPAQIEALFAAYRSGREIWQKNNGEPGRPVNICCAWFDEYTSQVANVADDATYAQTHGEFAARRATKLNGKEALRLGEIAVVQPASNTRSDVIAAVTDEVHQKMLALHHQHHEEHASGKTVSLGLVRFANINPLVAVARALMAKPSDANYCIHYCVYHGRHPLAVRSFIEKRLDHAFTRYSNSLWLLPEVQHALKEGPARHHLFVVLATSVVEVGRDWDADWGIIEPSSMRSLIQFAGRIQRHRQQRPKTTNLVVLNQNIQALRGRRPAYCKPGFENTVHPLAGHDLRELLPKTALREINAIPRILEEQPDNAFSQLEHRRLRAELLGSSDKAEIVAAQWWRAPITWSGELQKRTPFRLGAPQTPFFITLCDEDDEPRFMFLPESGGCPKESHLFNAVGLTMADGVQPWFDIDYREVLLQLAEERDMALSDVSLRYGEISLQTGKEDAVEKWLYHPQLGVFRETI